MTTPFFNLHHALVSLVCELNRADIASPMLGSALLAVVLGVCEPHLFTFAGDLAPWALPRLRVVSSFLLQSQATQNPIKLAKTFFTPVGHQAARNSCLGVDFDAAFTVLHDTLTWRIS